MNGLLHRLTARAMGVAPLVRSSAGLPYGGGSLRLMPDVIEPEFSMGRETVPQPGSVAQERSAAPDSAAPPQSRDEVEPAPSRDGVASFEPAALLMQQLPIERSLPVERSINRAEPDLVAPPNQTAPPRVELQSANTRMPWPATHDEPSRPPHRGSLRQPEPGVGASLRTASDLVDALPLLRPGSTALEPGAPRAPVLRSAAPSIGQAAGRTSDEVTEVHISIGRIDVTTTREPAPARRTQPAGQAPMSLDSYLARRGRS
jgi:hypothetical protein